MSMTTFVDSAGGRPSVPRQEDESKRVSILGSEADVGAVGGAADERKEYGRPQESQENKGRSWYHPSTILGWAVDNWFLIGIGVVIVLAWRFPKVASEGGVIRSEYSISYGAIALIFLITGLTLSTSALIHQAQNWRIHLFTQSFSFLLFPAIVFAIINIVHVSPHGGGIDDYVLAGMVIMSVMPTTVASNITMTRAAGGNVEAATIEVCIGNFMGAFLTPLLCKMFFSPSTWSYAQPIAKGGVTSSDGLKQIYKQLGKQLGLALFVPLFVGQVIQNLFPRQTKAVATTLRLPKVATFLLLLVIWSVFSTQFEQNAFEAVSTPSIIFIVFVNLALYAFFTLLCVFLARLPFLPSSFDTPVAHHENDVKKNENEISELSTNYVRQRNVPRWRKMISEMRFDKGETTAVCFCAAAKGLVVGAPVLNILYGGFDPRNKAILSIPLLLYQGQQVAVAQLLVYFFKKWNQKPDQLIKVKLRTLGSSEQDGVR